MSGIKPHTIRIWEQRYNLLSPMRTDSNFRNYAKEDVKYLIRLAGLNLDGNRISTLAEKSRQEIKQEFQELKDQSANADVFVQSLLIDMLNLDEESFIYNLKLIESRIGFENTYYKVCLKLIEKCDVVLTKRKILSCYQHFAQALMRRHLVVKHSRLASDLTQPGAKTFVLFLLDIAYHECALLFAAYKLKSIGHRVIYLGIDVSPENLSEIQESMEVDYLYTAVLNTVASKKIKNGISKIKVDPDNPALLVVNSPDAAFLLSDFDNDQGVALSSTDSLKEFFETISLNADKQQVA